MYRYTIHSTNHTFPTHSRETQQELNAYPFIAHNPQPGTKVVSLPPPGEAIRSRISLMPWPDQTRGLSEFATQTSSAASGQGMREVTAQPGGGNETTEPNRGLYELVPRSGEKKKGDWLRDPSHQSTLSPPGADRKKRVELSEFVSKLRNPAHKWHQGHAVAFNRRSNQVTYFPPHWPGSNARTV